MNMKGSGFMKLVIEFEVTMHDSLLVITTSTTCPFVSEVVVNVRDEPFCIVEPPILNA